MGKTKSTKEEKKSKTPIKNTKAKEEIQNTPKSIKTKSQEKEKSTKKEIPFINKNTLDKLDNPKYKLTPVKEEVNLEKFDAEARKNKEKNKHEEANKSKIRKNLNLQPAENSNKKTPKGKKENEIEFISQSEIEKKMKKEEENENEKIENSPQKNKKNSKGKKSSEKKIEKKEEENKNSNSNEENDTQNLDLLEKEKEKNMPKKSTKKAENKKEEIKIENLTFETIVNPEDLLKKGKLENSDFILLIIEVCQNALKYGLRKSDKSKLFWDEVFKNENFSVLFKQFKPETLRKYWKIIRDSDKVKSFINLVNRFHEKINRENIKLMTIINGISDSIKGKLASFENYLKNFSEAQNYREHFYKSFNQENLLNSENERKENVTPNKKNFLHDYEDISRREIGINNSFQTPSKHSNHNIGTNEKVFYSTPKKTVNENLHFFNKSESKYYNSNQKIKKITSVSEFDKNSFTDIEEIMNKFVNHFSNHSSDFIIECLKRNSFNLEDAYIQLSKPNEFEGFNDIDDYILINMRNSEFYNKLLVNKGIENIEKRRAFLNLNE